MINQSNLYVSPNIMGLIYQVYGLAFFILGTVFYMLPRQNTIFSFTKHLWLLSTFGILHGVVELLEFQRLCVSSEWLALASRTLLLFSYLPLLEFGRRVVSPERLPVVLVYGIVAIGIAILWSIADDSTIGIATGARFFVGFPAALLTAFALFSSLKTTPKHLLNGYFKFWIYSTALAFFCYGLATLVLSSSDSVLPSWLLSQENFIDWFGFPVQLLRAMCAMLITSGFVLLVRRINDDTLVDASVFNANYAIVITDCDTVILRANDAFAESTGYSGDEL
ncbi:MAG: hypothetical protein PHN45_08865, partial [Methylococcales bacterium]|nr:hypothetical protein [Methylococcales bacterium]